jgi:hypothetical protein
VRVRGTFLLLALLGACEPDKPAAPAPPQAPTPTPFPAAVSWEKARAPHAVFDAQGNAHVAFVKEDRIFVASEDANRAGFETPDEVAVAPKVMAGFGRGPKLAVAGRGMCLLAIDGEKGTLRAWTGDGIGGWSGPVDVTRVEGAALEGLHAVASDGGRRVFACWVDLRTKKPEIWGALSQDGGATWGEESCVYRSPSGAICPCCAPSATYLRDGTLAVLFRNEVEGARDPWVITSLDGGTKFEPASKLGKGTWKLDACPADGGAIVPADPTWIAIWRRDADVFISTPVLPEHRLRAGMLPAIATSGPGTWIGWQDARNGKLFVEAPGGTPLFTAADVSSWTLCGSPHGRAIIVYESKGELHCVRL